MIYQIVKGAIGNEYWVRVRNFGDRSWMYVKSFDLYDDALEYKNWLEKNG